jgi:hypothetical protein
MIDITEQHAHYNTLLLLVDMAKSFINTPLEKADVTIMNALQIMENSLARTGHMYSVTILIKTHLQIPMNGVPRVSYPKLITCRKSLMNTFPG